VLNDSTLELVGLLVNELNRVHSDLERPSCLVSLGHNLANAKDPLETALSEPIFDEHEASNRLQTILNVIYMRLLKKFLNVDLGHLLSVGVVIRAHQVDHLAEVDSGLSIARNTLIRLDQLLKDGLAVANFLGVFR